MADKEIAALSGAHLRGTRFVYIAIFWLLIAEIYPLKISRPSRRHGGDIQLGFQSDRLAYFSDIARETWCELNIFSLCIRFSGVVVFCVLFRS